MSQRPSHTPIELPLNQPKPSRKTRKNSQKNSMQEKTLTSMRAKTHTYTTSHMDTPTWPPPHAERVLCPQGSGAQVEVRSQGVLSFDREVYAQYPGNSFQTLTVSYRNPRTAGPHSTNMSWSQVAERLGNRASNQKVAGLSICIDCKSKGLPLYVALNKSKELNLLLLLFIAPLLLAFSASTDRDSPGYAPLLPGGSHHRALCSLCAADPAGGVCSSLQG